MKSFDRGILSSYDLKKGKVKVAYAGMNLLIIAMMCCMVYPILISLFNGLKLNTEVNSFPPTFLPKEWHFENYSKAWNYIDLPFYFKNTMLLFAGNMVVTILVLGLASYALSKMNMPFKSGIQYYFLMTLFIPATTYMIPNFINLKDLGLMGSFAAVWLPAGANAFFLLLLKTFMDGIHMEIFESARIDGASELRCFFQIAFPLSIPIFATLSIFVFATAWNDWFWPSFILSQENKPLSAAIRDFVLNARRLDLNIRFAILSIVMVPPVIIFLFFQKFILRGLYLGGVKG
ncbi:carbohydrate ABC transporter permease [Paenibacillus sp. PAMC21692]|uniref:carbohydrate ABC transporter permease n=1 Tax=Paenibacillus sp. PAMC21692 TaxID=2762320 RepID=UPI00164E095D|nr:carbohydrate ABC transporter permease [Paenibacillus sp. PAMC21692]QNK59674.1 carbohydrate ABC transporter permease [Paenibacillus sp. PAMC21692]